MLFSTMCWLFCYRFLIILDKIVHHISNESEDMQLLKPVCNYVLIWKIIKIVLDKLGGRSQRLLVPWWEHLSRCERLLVAKGLKVKWLFFNIADLTGRLSMGMSKATALKSWHNVVIQLMSATLKSFSFSYVFLWVKNLKSQNNTVFGC